MAYRFPPSMELLDLFLKQKGLDTSRPRSDRHALDTLIKATKIRVPFPKKGVSCCTIFCRLHCDLFPNLLLKKAATRARRVHGIGQVGPASTCRMV